MVTYLLYALSALFLGVGIYIASRAIFLLRDTRVKKRQIQETKWQLQRALEQVESTDPDNIIAGLQTLSMLNDPDIRVKAIRRLNELTQYEDPRVARQAEATINKVSPLHDH